MNRASLARRLVNSPVHLVAGQCRNDTLDLAPVAEAHDIARVAAVLGARRRLEPGVVAVGVDQRRRIGKGGAAGDEWGRHGLGCTPGLVTAPRTDGVNASSTTFRRRPWPGSGNRGLAWTDAFCHLAIMAQPTPVAGGFFLIMPIVAGFLWGITTGRAMQGALVGLVVGLVLALAVWLIDRARTRR